MNQIRKRLSKTNRRIRECNDRINLYRWRAVDRAKNPLAAQQAEQLLPLALDHLRQLHIHRRRLEQALEMDSPHESEIPNAPPLLPRLMR